MQGGLDPASLRDMHGCTRMFKRVKLSPFLFSFSAFTSDNSLKGRQSQHRSGQISNLVFQQLDILLRILYSSAGLQRVLAQGRGPAAPPVLAPSAPALAPRPLLAPPVPPRHHCRHHPCWLPMHMLRPSTCAALALHAASPAVPGTTTSAPFPCLPPHSPANPALASQPYELQLPFRAILAQPRVSDTVSCRSHSVVTPARDRPYHIFTSSLKFIPLAPSKARSPRQLSTKREPKHQRCFWEKMPQKNTFKKKGPLKGVLPLFDPPAPSLQNKPPASCSVSRRHSINEALHSWSCSGSRFQTVDLIVLPDDERWLRSLKNNPLNEKWPMKPKSGVKDCF